MGSLNTTDLVNVVVQSYSWLEVGRPYNNNNKTQRESARGGVRGKASDTKERRTNKNRERNRNFPLNLVCLSVCLFCHAWQSLWPVPTKNQRWKKNILFGMEKFNGKKTKQSANLTPLSSGLCLGVAIIQPVQNNFASLPCANVIKKFFISAMLKMSLAEKHDIAQRARLGSDASIAQTSTVKHGSLQSVPST